MRENNQASQELIIRYLDDLQEYPEDLYTYDIDGYECNISRSMLGHYCGYVNYGDAKFDDDDIDVHGGVTYNNGKQIGFDCMHYCDFVIYNIRNKRRQNMIFTMIDSIHNIGIENIKQSIDDYDYDLPHLIPSERLTPIVWTHEKVYQELQKIVDQIKNL